MNNRLIKSNDAGGGACTNTVDLYNPFPDGGGVALYQLNGDATDVSGNYDGTATNVTYGAGQFGQAGVFNGSSSKIDINATSTTPVDFSQENYSISLWLNPNSHTVDSALFSKWADTNASLRAVLGYITSEGKIWVLEGVGVNNNGATAPISVSTISTGVWTHVVYTRTGTEGKIYINGSLDVSVSLSNTINTGGSTNFNLGFRVSSQYGNSYLDGKLDQFRVFSRALRPYEVEALYTEEYCTPTIVPSEHFNTVTYTGNGTSQSITGVGFQPDFVWTKSRSISADNNVVDSVRGLGDNVLRALSTNLTDAENTTTSNNISSLDSDGFSVQGAGSRTNSPGQDYVAWNFKAGGAAVTNTDGTTTSQVSANTEAGFSVVTYGGPTGEFSVGHGLGVKPTIVMTKGRLAAGDWTVYFTLLDGSLDFMRLNQTSAKEDSSRTMWTDEVFYTTTEDSVAYCFAEVEGFSNFGSYVGTGASGNTVVTGFEPAFIMVKSSSLARNWHIFDNKRISGQQHYYLDPNVANAEVTSFDAIRFLENGFEFVQGDDQFNGSGASYIYMAFAADPTTIEPTLEDSFNTVLYTGNSTNDQSVTGVGFQPDVVWIKQRINNGSGTAFHGIWDSVRGTGGQLYPSLTNAETNTPNRLYSFDVDGFSLGNGLDPEYIGNSDYVAWNWKGAELPAINSNGSIPSVVSANPAAGFSIVSWTADGNGFGSDIGHGLGVAPKILITKDRDTSNDWIVNSSSFPNPARGFLKLNLTNALDNSSIDSYSFGTDTFEVAPRNGTSGKKIITYCFAEVAGFSKFGSYTGTGASGNTVTVGFEPAFVMIKRTDATGSWQIADNKRNTTNPRTNMLEPNTSNAENPISNGIDFNANDFTLDTTNGSFNASGGTYIYMAFANQF